MAWAAKRESSTLDVGLSREEARRRADDLIGALRADAARAPEQILTGHDIDLLRAASELLTERFAAAASEPSTNTEETEPHRFLEDAQRLYDFASSARWPAPDFGERAEVLADCAFLGWRIARRQVLAPEIEQWQSRFVSARSAFRCGERVDAGSELQEYKTRLPSPEPRRGRERKLFLADPAAFLLLLAELRDLCETDPAYVYEEAAFLYSFLESSQPTSSADSFLLDEREYLLGESARIAGGVCRHLSLRDESRSWLDLSESWFVLARNAAGKVSEVDYQRLALKIEERDFEPALKLLPRLIDSFERLGMREQVLKARFLEANALREIGKLSEAASVFRQIAEGALSINNKQVLSHAYVNLVQVLALLGEFEKAELVAAKAMPLVKDLDNRIGLAKLHWGIGYLERLRGDIKNSIRSFRVAQNELAKLDMHADIAAVHLVIADLLLDSGQEKQAEWEIRQALPLIDEYKLVPEGFAAVTLLRESLRRQKIDHTALRNLHEHFEQKKP